MTANTPDAPARRQRDAAFERDVLACLPDVARFARSLAGDAADADDLVQDTMLLAYRGYHTYRPGESVRRWLFTICRNRFVRLRARDERFQDAPAAGVAELIDPEAESLAAAVGHAAAGRDGVDDVLDRIDVAPAIAAALDALPDPFRVAVVLVDVEGYSYADAAAVEGVPVGTIRSRLFRARRLLQEQLFAHARDAGVGTHRDPPARDERASSPPEATS